MTIKSPTPKSLEDLIRNRYYHVPLYQRPYDWEIDKVSELWDDVEKNDPGYFLGFVLFKPKPSDATHPREFEVVDGQQRLTTLLLLLRAAVEILEKANESEEARDFHRDYIEQRSAGVTHSRPTLILSKRDRDKFGNLLRGEEGPTGRKWPSWKNLERAIEFFRDRFEELYKAQGKEGVIGVLNGKILKVSFIEVILGTDDDVYQFFETLNDRGKNLSVADLLKNRVCGEADKPGSPISEEDSAATIDRISAEISPSKFMAFLFHYCWANIGEEDPTSRKKLMAWYSRQISRVGNIKDFLDHLEKYSKYYVNFIEPRKCAEPTKREVLCNLDVLGVTRCYPLLLRAEEVLRKRDFLRLCKAIEMLTFRHSTVRKLDAKVLEGVFLDLIRSINKEEPIDKILEVLRKQPAMKSDDQFELAFAEFIETNARIARYTLWNLEEYISGRGQAPLDWDRLTLEHILAEKLDWEGKEEYLNRLGNLTLLSRKRNEEASNKPFIRKREEIYRGEGRIKMTEGLTDYRDFTKSQIVSRQKQLAKYAVKIWNSDNIE